MKEGMKLRAATIVIGIAALMNGCAELPVEDRHAVEQWEQTVITTEQEIDWVGCNDAKPSIKGINGQIVLTVPLGGDRGCRSKEVANEYCKPANIEGEYRIKCSIPLRSSNAEGE